MLGVLTKLFALESDAPQVRVNARGTEDNTLKRETQQSFSNDGGEESSVSAAPASPQWLSYYAKIAPQEISRWVNPEDGSGSISYEQLVENLNMFNIPVLPMRTFASSGNSSSQDVNDRSSTAIASLHKVTPPEVSAGAASALDTNGTQQAVLHSGLKQQRPAEKVPCGRSVYGSGTFCPTTAWGEQRPLAGEGVHGLPAGSLSRSDAHLQQSSENRSLNGTAVRPSIVSRPADDFGMTAVKQSPDTASCKPQLGCTAVDGEALHVPVTATHTTYIGPVREFRGTLSGVRDCGATRPGPHSQVPPDYIKVLNSDVRVFYDTETHGRDSIQTSRITPPTRTSAGGLVATPTGPVISSYSPTAETSPYIEGNADRQVVGQEALTPAARLFHKPPPLFLAPVMKAGAETRSLEACVTQSLSRTDDTECSRTGGRDAQTAGVTYSLGQYIWTAEDAVLGTAHKGEPEMDEKVRRICTGALFPAVLQPEDRSADGRRVKPNELEEKGQGVPPGAGPINIEDLGIPSIQEVCKEKIAQLQHLSGRISEYIRDDLHAVGAGENVDATVKSNRGGCGGLRTARCAKKDSVVFVERPMLKSEMTPAELWKVFQVLSEDQKERLATLEGCAADLSEIEALLCALHCRTVKAAGRVGAFQDFFGKMKMNAYALRCGEGWGLYPHAARIKHSCQPNVVYRNIDGLLVFFALTDIPEGSPITMSYIDQLYMPTQERRKRVVACKRIFCECPRCLDPIQPERTVLCPHCRPTKLCFLAESTEQHAFNHRGGEVAMEEHHAGLLQAVATDAGEDHRERNADKPRPDTTQTPAMEKTSKLGQTEHVKEKEGCAAVSSEKHVASSCLDSVYDGESKHSTDASSDASPSSVCSEPDREDGRITVCDKFCIVGTTIPTKRANTAVKKGTDNVEHRNADTDILESEGRRLQQEDSTCEMEKEGVSEHSDVASSVACGSREYFMKRTQTAYSCDDSKDSDGSSESFSTSLDVFTSADSSGNCSSSDFSEEEQEQSARDAVHGTPAEGKQQITVTEDQRCTDGALTEGSLTKTNRGTHCVFEGAGRWRCGACGKQFTDDDMPVALETYLTGYYAALRGRLGRPTPEAWNTECGQLIRTVEKVLGIEHWLYVAGHLMMAQLYLGMWLGGQVVDVILTQAFRHAALVVSLASRPAFSAAKSADVAPLVTAVLRVLLFNGRFHDFIQWIEKRGALQVIRESIGTYDEVYISFSTAYQYVRQKIDGGSDPSLALLHRFAHASQYTIALDAAYYEKKEAEGKERAAKIKASAEEEAKARTRMQTLQERQIQETRKHIAALKASSPSEKPKQVKDVTFSSPESVVGQYLRKYAAPGGTIANTNAALREGLRGLRGKDDDLSSAFSSAALTARAAYEHAKRVQQLAIEGRYPAGLSPLVGDPENGYLPLIMLADPLETGAQQLRMVRKSSEVVEREKKRCEEMKQMLRNCTKDSRSAVEDVNVTLDCKEHEHTEVPSDVWMQTSTTNEKSYVYRIPGLPGTAPGEFVTISQINHTKDGSYPPIPFFRTFFYVDHEARNMAQHAGENEEPPVNIKVLGCGAEGVAPLTKEELDDLAAARYNFLHAESERFTKEARSALVFEMGRRAQEAAAAFDSIKLSDARKSVPREAANPLRPVDIFHEVNKAVRDVVIQDARTVECIEKFRESRNIGNADDSGEVTAVHRPKKGHEEDQTGLSAQRTQDPLETSGVTESLTNGAVAPGTLHGATEAHLPGPKALEWRSRTRWDVPHYSVGFQSQGKSLDTEEASEQLAFKYSACRAVAQNKMVIRDLINTLSARRFLKPLDFSQIPPPPVLPACTGSPVVALHSQYKLARDAGRSACRQLQIRPRDRLPGSAVTHMQNSIVAAIPVSPVYTQIPPNKP